MRLVLLNSLPLTAIKEKEVSLIIRKTTPEEFKKIRLEILKPKTVISYIRHPETLKFTLKALGLTNVIQKEKEKYVFDRGDIVLAVVATNYERNFKEVENPNLEFYDIIFFPSISAFNP